MNTAPIRVIAEALLFSCVTLGLVFVIATQAIGPSVFVAAIALAHAVILGAPAYLFLRWRRWANALTSITGGVLVASLPVGLLLYPSSAIYSGTSAWKGGVAISINGVPTAAGWHSYWETVLFFGAFGAIAGFAFWLYMRVRTHNAT